MAGARRGGRRCRGGMISAGGSFELAMDNALTARRELRAFAEQPLKAGVAFSCDRYLRLRHEYDRTRSDLIKVHIETGTTCLFDGERFPERPHPLLDAIADGTGAS